MEDREDKTLLTEKKEWSEIVGPRVDHQQVLALVVLGAGPPFLSFFWQCLPFHYPSPFKGHQWLTQVISCERIQCNLILAARYGHQQIAPLGLPPK